MVDWVKDLGQTIGDQNNESNFDPPPVLAGSWQRKGHTSPGRPCPSGPGSRRSLG